LAVASDCSGAIRTVQHRLWATGLDGSIQAILVSMQVGISPTVQSKRRGLVGYVQHYKDAMLGRFYAICNCCSCCCGAMHAWSHGTPMLASSGYVAQVEVDQCASCGICAGFCQFGAISGDNGYADIDAGSCIGCGVCVSKCTQDALSLLRDPVKGEPEGFRVFYDVSDDGVEVLAVVPKSGTTAWLEEMGTAER
jgi:ferredoxin